MTKTSNSYDYCIWRIWADEFDYDVSTGCGEFLGEYDGDGVRADLQDGDRCPYCGKPIKRDHKW